MSLVTWDESRIPVTRGMIDDLNGIFFISILWSGIPNPNNGRRNILETNFFLNLFLFSTFIFVIKMCAFLQNSRDNNRKWKSLYSLQSLWSLNSEFECIENYWMHNYITRSSDLYFCYTISMLKKKNALLILNYTLKKIH